VTAGYSRSQAEFFELRSHSGDEIPGICPWRRICLHRSLQGFRRKVKVVDHYLRVTPDARGHLVLLLTMTGYARLHGMHPGFSKQSPVSQVLVTLETLQIMSEVSPVVDLVACILDPDVVHLMTFQAAFRIDFASEDRASVASSQTYKNVPCSIEVSLEFSDEPRF
jgi:hypothetical protein